MHLENIVIQARDVTTLGRFWTAALGLDVLTDQPDNFEGRLTVGEAWLDLCLEQVADPATPESPRLHLDLSPNGDQQATVIRLIDLGARPVDIGQGEVPWVVLADPEDNAFCVLDERDYHRTTGPIAALPLDSADPDRDRAFWRLATGWIAAPGKGAHALQHPSGDGLLLELCPEPAPAAGQNRIHLDVRPDPGESQQECVEVLIASGATLFEHHWGELRWIVMRDPSGNEFCVLSAPAIES